MRKRHHREGPIFFVDLDEDETVVVSVKVRRKFVEEMDRRVKEFGFSSRSDLIRAAINWFIKFMDGQDVRQEIVDYLKKRVEINRIVYENQNMSILAQANH